MLKTLSINNEYFQGDIKTKELLAADFFNCLKIEGHYPYSESHVSCIGLVINSGEIDKLIKYCFTEPVATLRLISKYCSSNSSNLSTAIDLLASFEITQGQIVLNQNVVNYSEFFAGRASALINFYDLLVRGFLAEELSNLQGVHTDQAKILSYLSNLPLYLTSLFSPGIYANLALRTNDGHENFIYHLKQQSGKNISEIIELIHQALPIPENYLEFAQFINNPPWARKKWGNLNPDEAKVVCQSHSMANIISAEIFQRSGVQGLHSVTRSLKRLSGIPQIKIEDLVGEIPNFINQVASILALPVLPLPSYVYWHDQNQISQNQKKSSQQFFELFLLQAQVGVSELKERQGFALHEAILATLQGMLYGLGFQRACYFVFDHTKQTLYLETTVGVKLFDYEKTEFNVSSNSGTSSILAILKNTATSEEESVFKDGWPYFAFPVIFNNILSGVFYGDYPKRPDSKLPDSEIIEALESLAKIWNF